MKKTCLLLLFATTIFGLAFADAGRYVGVAKCKMCHNSEARGAQYAVWSNGPHAKAYTVLGTDRAGEAASSMGVGDPQSSEACLRCHVTAYTADPAARADSWSMEEGVGCESCHGPGENYRKMSVMKDRAAAVSNGLVIPTVDVCVVCHNEESPTFEEFDFKARVAAIAHPNPQKAD
jgi:hypothetical protein